MKKLLLLFIGCLFATTSLLAASNLVISDFGGASTTWTTWGKPISLVANPSTVGDASAQVLEQDQTTGGWSGIAHWDNTPHDYSLYDSLEVDVYITGTTGQIQLQLGNSVGGGANFSQIVNDTVADGWMRLKFDISGLTTFDYQQPALQAAPAAIIYFDNITLIAKSVAPPTSISVSPSAISVIQGKTLALSVTPTPSTASNSSSFASGNSAVASVNSLGVVSAATVGTATITATSTGAPTVTATSSITVTSPNSANSVMFANFENSNPYLNVWASNPATGSVSPVVKVVANSDKSVNGSDSILSVTNCRSWAAVAFKQFDPNKINKVTWWVYSDSSATISDFGFTVGFQPGVSGTVALPLPSKTWTKMEWDITPEMLTALGQYDDFAFQLTSSGATTGYSFLMDSIELIAGSTFVPVSSFAVKSAGNVSTISLNTKTLQMSTATYLPANATNQTVVWSVSDTAIATIDAQSGLLTAVKNGTVTVIAQADGGGVEATKAISIAYSTNADLKSLSTSAGTLSPAFNASVLSYSVVLPIGTTVMPTVNAVAASLSALSVTITPMNIFPDTTTVEVDAEDGITTKTYTVIFTVTKSSDASLKSLSASKGSLLPAFSKVTFAYKDTLSAGTTVVPTISAVADTSVASVVITQAASLGDSAKVKVKSEDGKDSSLYSVTFYVISNDATLKELTASSGVLNPAFSPATTSYIDTLPVGTTVVPTITALVNETHAKKVITPAGSIVGSTNVVVTAEDGTTTKTYSIAFAVKKSSDAFLKSISAGSGVFKPVFKKGTFAYTVTLPSGTTVVPTVTAVADTSVASTLITQPVSTTGTATIVVTSEDGKNANTYTLTFKVAAADDATLSQLSTNIGTMTPDFDAATSSYAVTIPYSTKSVKVTYAATDAMANVVEKTNGIISDTLVVTAADGITKQTYTITYTKAIANTDATLKSLSVNGTPVLNFKPGTNGYSVVLPVGTIVLPTVTAVADTSVASVTINQAASTQGMSTILVTAEDGSTKIYTITFSVALSSDATLKSITLSKGTLSPSFSAKTYSYSVVLPLGTAASVVPTVTATADTSVATVKIFNTQTLPGNTTILVIAQDGSIIIDTVKFSITKSSNAALKSITLSEGTISFNSTTTEYNVVLPIGTTVVPKVTAVADTSVASVLVTKATSLPGSTTILVTAENGSTKTYTVAFTVAKSSDAGVKSISADKGSLLPAFDASTLAYIDTLPAGTVNVPTISAIADTSVASVIITKAATLKDTTIVKTMSEDKKDSTLYSVTFYVISNDATLKTMTVSSGTLSPAFSPATTSYSVLLPIGTTVLPTITASVNELHAKQVTTPATSLAGTSKIEVTAEDGTTKTYSIAYSVEKSGDAYLKSITAGGTLSPAFKKTVYSYSVSLPSGTTTVPTVTATADTSVASVVITKPVSTTGTSTIAVTSEDGKSTNTYTLTFKVAVANEATISQLSASVGTLSPAFDSATTAYTLTIPYSTQSVKVTYVITDSKAKVVEKSNGIISDTLVVTAADGITKKTYTITYTKAANTDATLKSLTSSAGILSPAFDATKSAYVVTLPAGTTTVPTITAVKNSSDAKVATSNASSLSGTTTITVTAGDNVTSQTYSVTFHVLSNDATLSSLTISSGTLSPTFSASKFAYSVTLAVGTTVIPTISAVTDASVAKAVITVATAIPGATTIVVTAEDGTQKTYTVGFVNFAGEVSKITVTGAGAASTITSIGGTLQMLAKFSPVPTDTTVLWSVSDTSIATINTNSGLLTSKKIGSIYVVANAKDGSGVVDSAKITIYIPVTSIKIDTVTVGQGQFKLVAHVLPANATDTTVTWSVSDNTMATIASGVLSVAKLGTVTITATANDLSKFAATDTITLTQITGVRIIGNTGFTAYPNPVSNELTIVAGGLIKQVDVINALGVVVSSVGNQSTISVSDLTSGFYIVRVTTTDGKVFVKSIIKK